MVLIPKVGGKTFSNYAVINVSLPIQVTGSSIAGGPMGDRTGGPVLLGWKLSEPLFFCLYVLF